MDWLLDFAASLEAVLFWPLVLISIVATAIGFFSFMEKRINNYAFTSNEWRESTWRTMVSAQGVILAWIVYGLIAAVPEPDYIVRERVEQVVNEVPTLPVYEDAFDSCMERREMIDGRDSFSLNRSDWNVCDAHALAVSNPDINRLVITNTVTRTRYRDREVEVVRWREPLYKDIYEMCLEGWDEEHDNSTQIREAQVCHNNAVAAVMASSENRYRFWLFGGDNDNLPRQQPVQQVAQEATL